MTKHELKQAWEHTTGLEKISFILFVIAFISSAVVAIKEPNLQTISAVVTNAFVLALMYFYAAQKAHINRLTAPTKPPH